MTTKDLQAGGSGERGESPSPSATDRSGAGGLAPAPATPLPWTVVYARSGFDQDVGITAPGCSGVIAECFEEYRRGERRPEDAAANARFIVRACNTHEDLVAALRGLLSECESMGRASHTSARIEAAHAALAKAEGR